MSNGRALRFLVVLVVLALVAPVPHTLPVDAAPPAPAQLKLPPVWEEPWSRATPSPSTWAPSESWVTRLSPSEQRALLGVPVEAIETEHRQALAYLRSPEAAAAVYSYPSHIDWRHVRGHDWTTSVKNQSGCNSCAAFATVAAIESRMKIRADTPDANPDLSEADLFFCSGLQCRENWYLSDAMARAANIGVTVESCYPYVAQSQTCSLCPNWTSQITKLESFYQVVGRDAIKQAVANGGPVTVDFLVYSDFFSYHGGVYRHTWGGLAGGHGVAIVGYSDCGGGYWILKNSWGAGWGEGGYVRMAYDNADLYLDDVGYVPVVGRPAHAACNPYENEAAIYSEQNYAGDCKVLAAGSYPSPDDLLPVGNDHTLSILVGSQVTATLYSDVNFGGFADSFTTDRADLWYSLVGDGTSSVKVEVREDDGPVPDRYGAALAADDDSGSGCVYLPDIRR